MGSVSGKLLKSPMIMVPLVGWTLMMMQRNWVWALDKGFTCLWLSSVAHVYLTCLSAFASASAGEQYGYVDVQHSFAWLKLTYVFRSSVGVLA